jgi:integrase/recombinase XerD
MDLTVVRPAGPTSLELLVDDYLMACKAKGLSRTTTENSYGYPLRGILLPWCAERGVDDVGQLDRRTSDAFSVYLLEKPTRRGTPLTPDSVHAYTRAVRGFLNWCEREGEEVTARPSLPKLPRHVRDVLDRAEIGQLVAAAGTERDRLILSILGDCGLRNDELCRLTVTDIIRRDRQSFLHVQGKGAKERPVPLPPALLRGIERYQRHGRPSDTRSERLFLGLRRGLSGQFEALTRSGVLKVVERSAERAGITKEVYPHLLRHSFITNALRGGMNPLLVAQIVGHSSLRMIDRVYSHLNAGDSYEALVELLAGDR